MGIKDRIDEYRLIKDLTPSAFEKEIGLSNGLWNKSKTVSEDVLIKFVERFPEVSEEWLIRGKGTMIKNEVIRVSSIPDEKNEELVALCTKIADNYLETHELLAKLAALVKKG